MAMPDSIGTTSCCNCEREVFVRKNRAGFAYYRCEGCGVAVQHHIMRHSEAFVKNRVKLENAEPEKPATKPAAQAKQPEKPAKSGGLLSGYLAGGGA